MWNANTAASVPTSEFAVQHPRLRGGQSLTSRARSSTTLPAGRGKAVDGQPPIDAIGCESVATLRYATPETTPRIGMATTATMRITSQREPWGLALRQWPRSLTHCPSAEIHLEPLKVTVQTTQVRRCVRKKLEKYLRCFAIAFSRNQRMTVISTPTSSPRQVESAVMAPTPALKATAKQARSPSDSPL